MERKAKVLPPASKAFEIQSCLYCSKRDLTSEILFSNQNTQIWVKNIIFSSSSTNSLDNWVKYFVLLFRWPEWKNEFTGPLILDICIVLVNFLLKYVFILYLSFFFIIKEYLSFP